jgi:hypothetical protein
MELVELYDKVDTADNPDTSYSSEDKPQPKDKQSFANLKNQI